MSSLVEGLGDDVITLLFTLFVFVIIIISWLSTNVRDLTFPANLLVIERRSRRLYTTADLNRLVIQEQHQQLINNDNSNTNTSSRQAVHNNVNFSSIRSNNATNQSLENTIRQRSQDRNQPSATRSSSNELELVNEIVEQALVDNLLDGEFYSTNSVDLLNNNNNNMNGLSSSSTRLPIASNSSLTNNRPVVSLNSLDSNQNGLITDNAIVSSHGEVASSISNQSEPVDANSESDQEDLINILIKFVNEKEMKIKVKPNDTVLFLKTTHFGQELSNNKIVRFIYQGQFLSDTNTLKSYNIKDQTTIHCHITTKPLSTSTANRSSMNEASSSLPISLQSIGTSIGSEPININNNHASLVQSRQLESIRERIRFTATVTTNETNQENIVVNNVAAPNTILNNQNTGQLISIDLNNFLLPIFAIVLSVCWYFRVNFKHFFSPLSTLILIIFTFTYGLFLFNNIHGGLTANLTSQNNRNNNNNTNRNNNQAQ